MKEQESILVVVAHPDDDVLGFGGTASVLSGRGHHIRAAILCGGVDARDRRPDDGDLMRDLREATRSLGLADPILGDFPNIRMNTVDHLDLVQFVEQAILESRATRIFTTHPGDINDDHRQTAAAALAAARLAQRRPDLPPLRSLHFMEVPSSTDWSFRGGATFEPDAYFPIGRAGLEMKLTALAAYRGVMRPYPHPRSREALEGLASYRGGQAGMVLAEAFQSAFLDLRDVIN